MVLDGYRVGDFHIPDKVPRDECLMPREAIEQDVSQPAAVLLRPDAAVLGCAPLMPDTTSEKNVDEALLNRLLYRLPEITNQGFRWRHLKQFCSRFFRLHFVPVSRTDFPQLCDQIPRFEWWLAATHYSARRREKMRRDWIAQNCELKCGDEECKAFVKREAYPEPKKPRMIVARSDAYKCYSGPWFKAIEETAFRSALFIKHVAHAERPATLRRFLGMHVFSSDFSSFEKHMSPKMMDAVELQFYKYMLSEFPEAAEFLTTHRRVVCAPQVLRTRNGRTFRRVPACRMSGEMCTSLGNGITNVAVMTFGVHMFGGHVDDCIVEGDDGVYAVSGHIPTEQELASIGLRVKLQPHDDASEAGFCQMFVAGEEEPVVVRDFRAKLVKFGWSISDLALSVKNRQGLLRSGALSLLSELPCCPVLTAVGEYFEKTTQGVEPIFESDGYHIDQPEVVAAKPIPTVVRQAYARLFDVSVDDQILLESEIRQSGLTGMTLARYCRTDHNAHMWSTHVRTVPTAVVYYRDRSTNLAPAVGA